MMTFLEAMQEVGKMLREQTACPQDVRHPDYGWILRNGDITDEGLAWYREQFPENDPAPYTQVAERGAEMKIGELKLTATIAKEHGLDRVILVITRKYAPTGERILVKGLGKGEIANVQERNGQIEIVAWFKVSDVDKYIAQVEKLAKPEGEK